MCSDISNNVKIAIDIKSIIIKLYYIKMSTRNRRHALDIVNAQ